MGESYYRQRINDSPAKEEVSSGGASSNIALQLQVRQVEPKARSLTKAQRVPALLREDM